MEKKFDINKLDEKIKVLRKVAEEIREDGKDIEAVKRNINRVLASTKMLEINVCDVKPFL
jgi:ribosomal protein L16/L10AE